MEKGSKKPIVVIIGAGIAGLTAANKLYRRSKNMFDLCVVEGSNRIGGRINTTHFNGNKIELGATWIHGIENNPIYKIAHKANSLVSQHPWELMHGFSMDSKIAFEGGFSVKSSILDSISGLFDGLIEYAQSKDLSSVSSSEVAAFVEKACNVCRSNGEVVSVGGFLRQGLEVYRESKSDKDDQEVYIEECVFAMMENIQRTITAANDIRGLDFDALSEYQEFPGKHLTIAKGFLDVIETLASVLPPGLIKFGQKVSRIEWQSIPNRKNDYDKPVKLHFCDGSVMLADHVIVTVSLGVLKSGIQKESMLFSPPLPSFKIEAIERLGFGVVNKLFLQLSDDYNNKFPLLNMVFHSAESNLKNENIPWWMRKTAFVTPIYENSNVLVSWVAGDEAKHLESLSDEEIIIGVAATVSSFLLHENMEFSKIKKSNWGSDPLFRGSYSYASVGSSGDDFDKLALPLPVLNGNVDSDIAPQKSESTSRVTNQEAVDAKTLQILFAGEATHRTYYSTTHGACLSGLREANRLLQHHGCDTSDEF